MCFETVDPVTIKTVVDNIATYYDRISAIPGWTTTDQAENVLGFSIWIDEAQALRKYEFMVDRSADYVPISGYKLTDVRLVIACNAAVLLWRVNLKRRAIVYLTNHV